MITKIKWKNHPVLKNLELDFTNKDGKNYSTIVIAGENGIGKTSILEALQEFFNFARPLKYFKYFDYIEYKIGEESYKLAPISSTTKYGDRVNNGYEEGFYLRTNLTKKEDSKEICINNAYYNLDELDEEDLRKKGCNYSKAKTGFYVGDITQIRQQDIEKSTSKYQNDDSNNYAYLKKYLLDIIQIDNNKFSNRSKKDKTMNYEKYYEQSKTYRFSKAFNNFFENLEFEGIDDDNNLEIVFSKNGKKITLEQLSSGEKQIVFRGAKLLSSSNDINGGIVLIDEPELSMHPKWQEKILKFYQDLFKDKNGELMCQLFIATHSEYVIKEALKDDKNCLVISLNAKNDEIEVNYSNETKILPIITLGEIMYTTFHIITTDFHIALYSYIQSFCDRDAIWSCDKKDLQLYY